MSTQWVNQRVSFFSTRHPLPNPISHLPYRAAGTSGQHTSTFFGRLEVTLPSRHCVRALDTEDAQSVEVTRDPEDVRGAIAVGLEKYEQKDYQEALKIFEKALKLPGTGLKRYRDKPRLISDGEKQSVLYNIACCYSRLQDARTGLVALAGCLETGYDDLNQLKTDPDLEFLRNDSRFEGLLKRFNLKSGKEGFFGSLLKGFNL